MSNQRKEEERADKYLIVKDLEVLGRLIGPEFSRIFAAITQLSPVSVFARSLLILPTGPTWRTKLGVGVLDTPTFAGLIAPYLRAASAAGLQLQDDAGNIAALILDGGNALYLGGAAGGANRDFVLAFATDASLAWGEAGDLFTLNKKLYISGLLGIGISPVARLHSFAGSTNYSPSLVYGSAAGWILQTGSVDLAGGVSGTSPYAYWIQARSNTDAAWPLSLNPLGGNVGVGTATPKTKLDVAGQITQSTNVIRGVFTKALVDGVATAVFTITTTNEAFDGGAYACFVKGVIFNGGASSIITASKSFSAHFTRSMITSGTGVNSAVSEVSESASAANDPASRDIGAVTMTVAETSEYVVSVEINADGTGTEAVALSCVLSVELVYTGFLTAPVMANA